MCLITDHLWCHNEVLLFPYVHLIYICFLDTYALPHSMMCIPATYGQTIFFIGLGSYSMLHLSYQKHEAVAL